MFALGNVKRPVKFIRKADAVDKRVKFGLRNFNFLRIIRFLQAIDNIDTLIICSFVTQAAYCHITKKAALNLIDNRYC